MEPQKHWIRAYVLQILPLVSIFIYILGFAFYIPYYYYYGINIISHISISEILILTFIPLVFLIKSF